MSENIGARLLEYFDQKGVSQVDIAAQLGVSKAYINSLFTGRRPFGKKQAELWAEKFGFSKAWLLTGNGEMLKDGAGVPVAGETYREDDVPECYMTYLVPMAAMGGSLVGFKEAGVRREDCERVVTPIADIDWAVPVCGDSMEPEYPNGSRVLVKQINPSDFIAWGNVFVLDTTNGIIIKVVKQSDREGYVRCVSLNPSGRYQPFDVPMRSIRAMYRVIVSVSMK